jgi:predicted phage terminase large subunit-like protein
MTTPPFNQEFVLRCMRETLEGYSIAQFPDFKPGRHHKLLASKLEDVAAGRIKRLCVLMAPRHGKSKLSSELFPSWYLGHNPNKRILSLSYGQDLADVFGRSVRNYMRTPTYGALFPECQLSSDSNSIKRFNTTAGGGYATIGVGGATTGRGADLLIMDDLIKDREQADSPVYREGLIDWYRSVARTRLQPGGSIVLVQTRWGTTDFVAWLLSETSHENWEVISLPAIALDNDPLGRLPGEALWPESYPLSVLEETRLTLGSRDWNALYQQCPLSDADVIFSPSWLQFYDQPPKPDCIIQSWDLSFGGQNAGSSWVVGQTWGMVERGNSRHKYLLQMTRDQLGFSDTLRSIKEMDLCFSPEKILIENKACGPAVIETLSKEIGHRLTAVEPQGGKSDRAYAVVPQFERGEVWFPDPKLHPWVKPLLTEMESFPKSVTDDCVDAMTQALLSKEANQPMHFDILPTVIARSRY